MENYLCVGGFSFDTAVFSIYGLAIKLAGLDFVCFIHLVSRGWLEESFSRTFDWQLHLG